MATNDGTARLLHRVTRDLQAPMALLAATHPERVAVAHCGFESDRVVCELLAVHPDETRKIGTGGGERRGCVSWSAAPVQLDGVGVGTLFVADRRRRWFDDEELRHLGLLSFAAGPIIGDLAAHHLDLNERAFDLREQRDVVVSATSG